MKCLLLSFIWVTSFAMAEVDPCKEDYKNRECQFRVSYSLSGQYDMFGNKNKMRPEYATYVDNYYKKYGIEGFLYQKSRNSTLFEEAFSSCNNVPFKEKLLKDFPKGRLVGEKNIYQLLLPDFVFSRKNEINNFIFNLNKLFPENDNENFKKTQELFGFPWDDPAFVSGYIDTIKELVERIDSQNEFFKRSEFFAEKEQLLKIIDRLAPLAKINEEVCSLKTLEEVEGIKSKYPDLFLSSKRNVIGCLLKNEQCELAGHLINSGEYPADRLSEYFDSIINLKNSKACVETMKSIFMTMLRNGNPIVSNPKYLSVGALKDITNYYHKYPFDDQYLCGPEYVIRRNNLDDFTANLRNILEFQGLEIMNKILSEKDPIIKESLVNQFADIHKLDVDLSKVDPASGKTILHLIADAGDYSLLDSLISKGIDSYSLGSGVTDKNGLKPLYYAIESGEMNKLKFAQQLYSSVYKDAGEMLAAKWYLKKIKTKDPEVKQLIKDFKLQIDVDLSHEY